MPKMKIKPEDLTLRGRREFVVLTVKDFERMKEAIEDADDLRTLRAAKRRNARAPYYTLEEVEARLGTGQRAKKVFEI